MQQHSIWNLFSPISVPNYPRHRHSANFAPKKPGEMQESCSSRDRASCFATSVSNVPSTRDLWGAAHPVPFALQLAKVTVVL